MMQTLPQSQKFHALSCGTSANLRDVHILACAGTEVKPHIATGAHAHFTLKQPVNSHAEAYM